MENKTKLNLMTKQLKNKKGFALVGTLILVFVVSTFAIALLTMTQNEIKSSALQKASKETFYIAESGIDHAISYLENLGTPDFPSPHYLTEENDHYIDLGNGKYKASIQSAGTFSYIIQSTGERPWSNTSGKISKTIEIKVILENFALYAYFSDIETFPKAIYPPFGEGRKIWFYGEDHIRGPLHSNDRLHMAGTPTFDGTVSSAWVNPTDSDDVSWEAYDAQTNPNFNGVPGFEGGVDNIPLPEYREISDPTDENSLQRIAAGSFDLSSPKGAYVPNDGFNNVTDGIWVSGIVDTLELGIDYQGNSEITIVQTAGINKTTTITTIETPVTIGGTTYPSGTTLIDVLQGGSHSYTNPSGYPNGVLYVDGEIRNLKSVAGEGLKGKLTIATNSTVTISDNLIYNTRVNDEDCFDVPAGTYPNIPDSLGLVSEGNIMVADGAPHNIEINAILMALGTSFYYEGWKDNMQGDLTFHGSFIQKQRGPVGTFNSWGKASGYTKQYYFDTRMSIGNPNLGQDLPPYFPTTGKYIKLYWKEL